MTHSLPFAHEPLFYPHPIKSLCCNDLYALVFYSLFFNMFVTCTGFYVSIPVPNVSFCTFRFLHYIVQNLIPITTVQQTISLLVFRITPQNHLFLIYTQNSRPEVYTDVHLWTGYLQKTNDKNHYTGTKDFLV